MCIVCSDWVIVRHQRLACIELRSQNQIIDGYAMARAASPRRLVMQPALYHVILAQFKDKDEVTITLAGHACQGLLN